MWTQTTWIIILTIPWPGAKLGGHWPPHPVCHANVLSVMDNLKCMSGHFFSGPSLHRVYYRTLWYIYIYIYNYSSSCYLHFWVSSQMHCFDHMKSKIVFMKFKFKSWNYYKIHIPIIIMNEIIITKKKTLLWFLSKTKQTQHLLLV